MSDQPPPFPRECQAAGFSGTVWCHGFFGGTKMDGKNNVIPHPLAVIEDPFGGVSTVYAEWVRFPK